MAAGEERRRDLFEMRADRGEGLVEAPLDCLGELRAQLLELLEARLEILALLGELGQALLLAVVLLLGERIDLAESLAAALQTLDPGGELLAVVALRRLGSCLLEPPARLARLGLQPRALDVDSARALAGLGGHAAHIGLLSAQPPQLGGELPGLRGARVHPGPEGRLEPLDRLRRARQRGCKTLGQRDQRLERNGRCLSRKLLGPALELLGLVRQGAPARVELEQHSLGRLAGEPELASLRVVAVTFSRDENAALRAREVARLGEPDVGEQFGDPLAAGPRLHTARQGLRACERRAGRALFVSAGRHQHAQVAQAGFARPVDEPERGARVGCNYRGGAAGQGRGDRALVAGLDLEQRERQLLPFLCERPRRGRQAFALGQRVLEHGQAARG